MSALANRIELLPRFKGRGRAVLLIVTALLILLATVSLLAPVITTQDPTVTNLSSLYLSPSGSHLLGTDSNGRDLLSRLAWGGRTALFGPLVVTLLSAGAGAALALIAAWCGGRVDSVISRTFDLLFAFPGLLLAILGAATFGKGLGAATIALAISYTPYMGRIVRGAATHEVVLPYVTALRANDFGAARVITRHLLPNLRPLILSQAAVLFGYAMVDLAAISFLGLGVQQPQPDWGVMLAEGMPGILSGHPEEALFAGILLAVVICCVNLLAERLGDRREDA